MGGSCSTHAHKILVGKNLKGRDHLVRLGRKLKDNIKKDLKEIGSEVAD
jgi:hypothetical protein